MNKPKNRAVAATNWAVEEVDQLFVKVARYTRFVLFSKWFLGVFALLILVGLIAWPLITNDNSGVRVSFVSTDGTVSGTHPVMNAPRFSGSDHRGQQYTITAKQAIQQTPQTVLLEQVEGQLLGASGRVLMARANSALFHQDTKMVELSGNVNLMDDQGMFFVTEKLVVNVGTMDVDGSEKIEGSTASGKLVATGLKIRDSGNSITFGTVPRVNVTIQAMRQR